MMRTVLHAILLLVFCCSLARANTEKVIFTAPDASSQHVDVLDTNPSPIGELSAAKESEQLRLRVELPRAFPSADAPRGVDSWVHLKDLKPGARYEARVCWAATVSDATNLRIDRQMHVADLIEQAPSDFWLSVHPMGKHVLGSHMYLKISAIASYYTTNATLMQHPEPVLADIILDEFLLGVLPRSLLNVGLFIVLMGAASWYMGIWVVDWITAVAQSELKKKAA
ncbi:hypothetical protein Dda_3029 [Drechslerella dactyloides]|uniref:Uncharacterized protein n=1 Tax=Drechslerella dactyloides TaxID=74499 RepID=A0AAD6NKV9_DREDA|nr:hypothetical protein Dda_3029 [Drechslerella dactyloides]